MNQHARRTESHCSHITIDVNYDHDTIANDTQARNFILLGINYREHSVSSYTCNHSAPYDYSNLGNHIDLACDRQLAVVHTLVWVDVDMVLGLHTLDLRNTYDHVNILGRLIYPCSSVEPSRLQTPQLLDTLYDDECRSVPC